MTKKTSRKIEARVFDARPSLPRLTSQVRADMILDRLTDDLKAMLKYSTEKVEKFTVRLIENAAGAFEWSHGVFDDAAEQYVARHYLAVLERLAGQGDEYDRPSSLQAITWVREDLLSEVIRSARYPEHSTSSQHNEMKRSIASYRARVLESLDGMMKFMQ